MVHAGDANNFAPHLVDNGFTFALNGNADFRTGASAHAAHRLAQVIRVNGLAIHSNDQVAAANSRARRR